MFDELKASLKEAVEIKQGYIAPAGRTKYEATDVKAICLKPKGITARERPSFKNEG